MNALRLDVTDLDISLAEMDLWHEGKTQGLDPEDICILVATRLQRQGWPEPYGSAVYRCGVALFGWEWDNYGDSPYSTL